MQILVWKHLLPDFILEDVRMNCSLEQSCRGAGAVTGEVWECEMQELSVWS